MTKRTMQSFLEAMHGLHLGLGEITSILHTVAGYGREEKRGCLPWCEGGPYINADEIGWREDGQNGYIWTFSTSGVRYFVFVEDPRVPSDNNGAERSLRPAVIARKVCGGTKMTLMSVNCYTHRSFAKIGCNHL